MIEINKESLLLEGHKGWRSLRLNKDIKLSGGLSEYVGCSYAHLAQWEKKENHPMSPDKIQRYKFYIENYEKEGVLIGK